MNAEFEAINMMQIVVTIIILVTLSTVECRQHTCDVPPSVWCSSIEIARACEVEDQCTAHVWSKREDVDDRVQLTLYMESLCPDCRNFIIEQLYPTYNKLANIMDLRVVPYGNAQETEESGKWVFDCQHGEEECLGNIIETCAIHIHNQTNVWFPFIACIEMSDALPSQSALKCAKQTGVDIAAVMACTKSPMGNQLEHEMALDTDKLDPPHEYVPWVVLNGIHTDDIEKHAESDLTKLICDTYKGAVKPDACKLRSNRSYARN